MTRTTFALFLAAGLALSPAARAQNCGALPNTLTNGTLADATQVMANFNQLLTCINALAAGGGSSVRQVVTSGPMTAGVPSLLPATSGSLSLQSANVSATTPLTVTAANGYDPATGKQRDVAGSSTSNLTWSGLAANTTYYLYVTVAANGALTTGVTTREPVYQAAGTPSIQSGQFTFNISEMNGYLGNGSLAPQANAVFVGTATTGASSVTGTLAYGYNGRYESPPVGPPLITNNWVSGNHNLGLKPDVYDFIVENVSADYNYTPGDTPHAASLAGDYGGSALPLGITANKGAVTFVAGSSSFYISSDKFSATRVTLNPANWRYKYVVRRGW